ncbi:MAG: ribonuclease P protein component [Parasporobacterium sp.]|nr:ribonuclease P protein component [Parasporobacterium sp.]
MKNIDSLKNTAQFREVYEKGRSCANDMLVLYVLATGGDDRKLGISVSKKVGNSVVRHRIARLIRESFLSLKNDIPAGYTIVVVARYRAKGKTFSDICGAMLYLYKKMNLVT